jgi:peroxiredoxin Q/BCP
MVLAIIAGPANLLAAPPAVGQPAPGFTLSSQHGTQVSLAGYRGKWVVLYFYPRDLGTDSTAEAKNFQKDLPQYEAKNSVILGVSEDPPASHLRFSAAAGLSFPLLSDTGGSVAKAYGSLGVHAGAPSANRNTFLIDPQGKIAKVWTSANPAVHSAQVLTQLSLKPPIVHAMQPEFRAQPQSLKPPIVH